MCVENRDPSHLCVDPILIVCFTMVANVPTMVLSAETRTARSCNESATCEAFWQLLA